MSQTPKKIQVIPQTTWRRLRNTPSYFFLLWRWTAWLYALIWIVSIHGQPYPSLDAHGQPYPLLATALLVVTFLQTLIVTLYAPVFQFFIPHLPRLPILRQPEQGRQSKGRTLLRRRPRPLAADEEPDILTPLARTRNPNWDIALYGIDLLICSAVTYLGGYFGSPHFGSASPFYRYCISTDLAAALTYRFRD